MTRGEELREFVRRDWARVAEAKRVFWVERRRRTSAAEALRIADELRQQVRAVRPDWPTAAAREADLAAHLRLASVLRRAPPRGDR